MSVKLRLTLAVVGLLALAVGALGWTVVRSTQATLVEQVDDRLREAGGRELLPRGPFARSDEIDGGYREVAALRVASDGAVVGAEPAGFPDDPVSLPDVAGTDLDGLVGTIRTVPSVDGSVDYRATARPLRGGDHVVLATSLEDVAATTSDLLRTVLAAGVVVVLLGAATSWFLIGRALRPVRRMIDTASAIAAGDLTQRVDHHDDGTELGRLATALDEMLGRLEVAFAERAASEQRLRRFVGDASHELRNPVATIRGYAELYEAGGLPPGEALERAMRRIGGESERMARLVDDLLLLARLDQHRPLDRAPVDLSAVATDAVADLRVTDPDRPVSLSAPDGAAVVAGDRARLHQVVASLLENARMHTPAGTPVHVGVRVAEAADDVAGDATVRLTVADEGPGIHPAHHGQVFERFYRTDESRARATGGSGLGLAIVAAVVHAHGGRVELDGAPGTGAAFTIVLPALPPVRVAEPDRPRVEPRP